MIVTLMKNESVSVLINMTQGNCVTLGAYKSEVGINGQKF